MRVTCSALVQQLRSPSPSLTSPSIMSNSYSKLKRQQDAVTENTKRVRRNAEKQATVPEAVRVVERVLDPGNVTEWKQHMTREIETKHYRLELILSSPITNGTPSRSIFSFQFRRYSVPTEVVSDNPKDRFKWCNWLNCNRAEIEWLLDTLADECEDTLIVKDDALSDVVHRSLTVEDHIKFGRKSIRIAQTKQGKYKESVVLIPWKDRSFVIKALDDAEKIIGAEQLAVGETSERVDE